MKKALASLLFAATLVAISTAAASAQDARPVPQVAPSAPMPPAIYIDVEEIAEAAKAMKLDAQALTLELHSKEFELQARVLEEQMKQLTLRQFPVPNVNAVPPQDPRRKTRDRERRRIPEGFVESTEPFTRSFPVTKGSMLMLSNIAGNVQVAPGAGDRIEVEALKHAWGPNAEESKKRLSDAVIETYASGNRVEVRVEHSDRRDARGLDVELTVKVPPDAGIDLRTVSGDVRITNVKGEVRVQGANGNIQLDGVARLASVKTVSGDLTLNNVGSDLPVSIYTVNGSVLVQSLAARTVDVNTVNGDVRIAGWTGDRAHIRSLDGDLDLQSTLTKGGRYEIESHSGNINLSLPEQPGFDLEAHTFNGRIRIDFPIRSEGPIRDNDRGPRSVRGTYGDASSSLRLQTFNGNLTVTRR